MRVNVYSQELTSEVIHIEMIAQIFRAAPIDERM